MSHERLKGQVEPLLSVLVSILQCPGVSVGVVLLPWPVELLSVRLVVQPEADAS